MHIQSHLISCMHACILLMSLPSVYVSSGRAERLRTTFWVLALCQQRRYKLSCQASCARMISIMGSRCIQTTAGGAHARDPARRWDHVHADHLHMVPGAFCIFTRTVNDVQSCTLTHQLYSYAGEDFLPDAATESASFPSIIDYRDVEFPGAS